MFKWRRLLLLGMTAVFVWRLISHFEEIEALAAILAGGAWGWVLLTAVFQLIFYIIAAGLLKFSFDIMSLPTRWRDMIPVTFISLFVNSTAPPAGGAAGFAMTVDDARRRGGTAAQAASGALLNQVINYAIFSLLLGIGMIILASRQELMMIQVVSAAILFAATTGMVLMLSLGLWRPTMLRRLLAVLQKGVNRVGGWVKRPSLLSPTWHQKHTDEFIKTARGMAGRPSRLIVAAITALAMHTLSLLSLYTLFLAFNQPASPSILIIGYSMTMLFTIVSPTPSGIGVVETIVPLIYKSVGIPASTAAAIILSFRGLSFWIPLLAGFLLLNRFGRGARSR